MNNDTRYAVVVGCLVLLAMGFAGWYENYVPVPQPNLDRVYTAQQGAGR